jgi:membrane-bound lytic murein transglycosylase D
MKKYVSVKFVSAAILSVFLVSCGGAGKGAKNDAASDVKTSAVASNETCESDYEEIPDEETFDALSQPARTYIQDAQNLYVKSNDYLHKKKYDRALSLLDEAYAKLLKIDPDERGGEYQQIEDLRFNISKRVMEIYAIRNKGFKSTSNEIPIVLNQHVNREIKSLTTTERTFFVNALARSSRYLPMIKSKMKEAGIPEELAWLALIESGFRTNAYSPARALGMWQFIASTGHRYGLKRDEYIDERMDPEKSTDAAIAYLKELHQMFGDWETVLASYNCGEGRVLRTIRGQNINYLDNFWDLYDRLPGETARYVPRFIATLHIINNLKDYDLAGVGSEPPLSYETVSISRRVSVKELGRVAGLSECVLKDLNPELRHGITPSSGYVLKIPSGYSVKILASVANMQEVIPPRLSARQSVDAEPARKTESRNQSPVPSDMTIHKVQKGETLYVIAKKYNISADEIIRLNNYGKKTRLRAGSAIKIPVSKKSEIQNIKSAFNPLVAGKAEDAGKKEQDKPVQVKPALTKEKSKKSTYTVKNGDTLWTIAKNHGTTPEKIISMNNLSGSDLKAGRTITVPLEIDFPESSRVVRQKDDNALKSKSGQDTSVVVNAQAKSAAR